MVYVCPRAGRCRDAHARWTQTMGVGLGLVVGNLGFASHADSSSTSPAAPRRSDEEIMSSCDVLISTARAWDRATRNWQRSPSLSRVRLFVFDRLELLGVVSILNSCFCYHQIFFLSILHIILFHGSFFSFFLQTGGLRGRRRKQRWE